MSLKVGDKAPAFRLPSAQGGDVALQDYAGRNVIVWFDKGMACPFCRQKMSQLARSYARFKALDAEVLEVTVTRPEKARAYARSFPLPFPYLCDPDYRVRKAWGMDVRSHGPLYYAKMLKAGLSATPPPSEFGEQRPSLGDLPSLLTDDDMGFFVLDGAATVRYASAGPGMGEGGPRTIPGTEEIIQVLERVRDERGARRTG